VIDAAGQWIHDRKGTAGIRSTKITRVIDIIKRVKRPEKVLIFSIFKGALELVYQALREFVPDRKTRVIHGGISLEDRQEAVDGIKHGDLDILLASYKISSRGLNLMEASHVICLEEWWTPDVMEQAIGRCYRRGQTRIVHAYHIIMRGTIEEKCKEVSDSKIKIKNDLLKTVTTKPDRNIMRKLL
jgi:SNF2 family DNA or RNA helicase